MLILETYLDKSLGRGIGLFAAQNVMAGTKYWVRDDFFDKIITPWQLSCFKKRGRDYIRKYGFKERNGNWYLCGDNARFSNHSINPNTSNHFDNKGLLQFCTISKDIKAGDEILCNYVEICSECKKGVKFMVL